MTPGLQGLSYSQLPGMPYSPSEAPLPAASAAAHAGRNSHCARRQALTTYIRKLTMNPSVPDGLWVYLWACNWAQVIGNCFRDDVFLKKKKNLSQSPKYLLHFVTHIYQNRRKKGKPRGLGLKGFIFISLLSFVAVNLHEDFQLFKRKTHHHGVSSWTPHQCSQNCLTWSTAQ